MATERLRGIFLAQSWAELQQAIEINLTRCGFRYFMFHARLSRATSGGTQIYFDNCPDAWRRYYQQYRADGLLGLCGRPQVTPMLWTEMALQVPALFERAAQLGLLSGATHPVHSPGGQWSCLSFIKDRSGVKADREIQLMLPECQFMAGHVHDAASRILQVTVGTAAQVFASGMDEGRLNERERQVLTWAAAGKTASETSLILSIAERTVLFYLASARQKLGASNSCHAISKALSLGLIDARRAGGGAQTAEVKGRGQGKALGLAFTSGVLAALFGALQNADL
jgi:DNA-binding CsgD family transcriptional regulator